MKKVFLLVPLLFLPFFASAQTFEKNLSFGIQNDPDVTKLQEFLADDGLYSGPITGNFFSLTLKAVKSFQTREGISPAAGYFGSLTRAKANAILSSQVSASNEQAVSETGSVPRQPEAPKTTNDVVTQLMAQIQLLQQQLNVLQQQQNTLNRIAQNTPTILIPTPTTPTPAPPQTQAPVAVQPTPLPTPVTTPVPTPTAVTALLLPKRLNYGGTASWPNGNNYGNVNDGCNNCVVLITEVPTTANIYLMEDTMLRGGPVLDSFATNNPHAISIYADDNLSVTHVFLFSHMDMDRTKKYLFIVDATEQSGAKYVQQFGGVDLSSTYLSGPFKWGENQKINWISDYPSQYMKSNYYVDVSLRAVK